MTEEPTKPTTESFEALTPLGGPEATIRFAGPFEGKDICWEARIVGLAPGERRFIEIGEPSGAGVPVTIGLPVERIDEPTVLKVMVMMRQYKRLQRGRHEFGLPV